jgi:hypothetical protein
MYDDDKIVEMTGGGLEGWVIDKCDAWRAHYESNYQEDHDEYYRLWRGIWAKEDSMRDSERSRIISPALQQAVESSVAEIEEATFGRGQIFDIKDDYMDQDKGDIAYLRNKLHEDMHYTKTRKNVSECLLSSAIYGTGIGEIVLEEVKEMKPATEPVMGGELMAVGVNTTERFIARLRPVLPHNFLIDPVATSIEEALGVAVDQFVPIHQVRQDIEKGYYNDVDIETAAADTDLEADKELAAFPEDKVRLTRYYGLVPRELLDEANLDEDEEIVELSEEDQEAQSEYVEAIVVIANGGVLLKAEANPYMMGDRPIVAFPWDTVPGRFWGRGVCEKGYNSQKALDTELRARIDALALTIHPMIGIDASRLPRGMKPEVRPGKMFLTNGNPSEILQPFKFGALDQTSFVQTQMLQTMVQQATGAVDSAGLSGQVNGEATAAGISMGLGAIIKRQKRTLINFQELFLIPMVEKMAWRSMQFDPDNYPVADYKFVVTSSLGIIAREYEVTQLVQLLQTMKQDSPAYPLLIESIIDNMNLSNREDIIKQMREGSKPNPEQQAMEQQHMQLDMATKQATTDAMNAQAAESMARAAKYKAESDVEQYAAETDRIKAVATNMTAGDGDDKEFEKRFKKSQMLLKEREVDLKEQDLVTRRNMMQQQAAQSEKTEQQLMSRLGGNTAPPQPNVPNEA